MKKPRRLPYSGTRGNSYMTYCHLDHAELEGVPDLMDHANQLIIKTQGDYEESQCLLIEASNRLNTILSYSMSSENVVSRKYVLDTFSFLEKDQIRSVLSDSAIPESNIANGPMRFTDGFDEWLSKVTEGTNDLGAYHGCEDGAEVAWEYQQKKIVEKDLLIQELTKKLEQSCNWLEFAKETISRKDAKEIAERHHEDVKGYLQDLNKSLCEKG